MDISIEGTVKTDTNRSIGNIERELNTTIGSSYYTDIELYSLEVYQDNTFSGSIYIDDEEITIDEVSEAIQENYEDSLYFIDTYTLRGQR